MNACVLIPIRVVVDGDSHPYHVGIELLRGARVVYFDTCISADLCAGGVGGGLVVLSASGALPIREITAFSYRTPVTRVGVERAQPVDCRISIALEGDEVLIRVLVGTLLWSCNKVVVLYRHYSFIMAKCAYAYDFVATFIFQVVFFVV